MELYVASDLLSDFVKSPFMIVLSTVDNKMAVLSFKLTECHAKYNAERYEPLRERWCSQNALNTVQF